METYIEMQKRHQEEFNALPIKYAFSKEQLDEGIIALGLHPSEKTKKERIVGIGYGGFMRKEDVHKYTETLVRHADERTKAINEDKTGDGFIYQMFYQELANHEYSYTGDDSEVLALFHLTAEDFQKNPALLHGLEKAEKELLHE